MGAGPGTGLIDRATNCDAMRMLSCWRRGVLRKHVCLTCWSMEAHAHWSFPDAGLIGWVPNCDTLHALIREYRDVRKIPLNVEHRLMLGMAPDYDHLTVIQKVEVFEHALESTSGART